MRLVPLKDIKLNPKNRNKHSPEQIAQFVKILRYQGNRNPGVISNRSGLLVAGEGRYLAMKEAGETHMPVMFQDFEDEEQEYLYGISDNAIASQAALDLAEIHVDLKDMGPFDLDLLGIRDFQFEPDPETQGDPDAVPEVPKAAKTKRGELWALGSHRLLIDDCTVKENVDRLMGGEKADMVFTDPPYGVGYEYHGHDDDVTAEEHEKFSRWLVDAALGVSDRFIITPGCNNLELYGRIKKPTHIACWTKTNAMSPGRVTYFWTWEPIFFYGKFPRKRGNDVFDYPVGKQPDTGIHTCPKPITLWLDIVENFSDAGNIIFDFFTGSGSTLIACEKTNRRCFGMEIEPLYGDVILSRFAKFSGKDPVREDGMRWSELNAV